MHGIKRVVSLVTRSVERDSFKKQTKNNKEPLWSWQGLNRGYSEK
jgi:hypothetical protein